MSSKVGGIARAPVWGANLSYKIIAEVATTTSSCPFCYYNCALWTLSKALSSKLDTMSCIWHRKKLNFLMNIHHPHHITNNHLYSQTNSIRITSICRERRLLWFGHVVRQCPHSPSYQALMLATDTSDIKKPRRRPPPPQHIG